MKLIGIKLHSCDSYIRKSLKEDTWYPFGQYQEPTQSNGWKWQTPTQQKNDILCTRMYQVMAEDKNESLSITVNCIVGKNGSGKSSLLDILYRIINNFSYRLIDAPQRDHYLFFAQGIDATLYFETDNVTSSIHNCYDNIFYGYYSDKIDARFENLKIDKNLSRTKIEQITRHFFYSICTNYSIHALNEIDYAPPRLWIDREGCNIDGKWINGLFHKNDGYVIPITMVPYREDGGNIDIKNENILAKQRLSTLAILFASQSKMFMGQYKPKYIIYRFRQDACSEYDLRFCELCHEKFPWMTTVGHFRDDIKRCWKHVVEAHYKTEIDSLHKMVMNALLMYLSYKTLKICIQDRKYGAMLGIRHSTDKRNNDFFGEAVSVYSLKYSEKSISSVINKILFHDTKIHINQKIQQVIYWLKNATYNTESVSDTDKYIGVGNKDPKDELPIGWYKKPVENLYTQKRAGTKTTAPFKTYDQAFLSMPPSIFEWDITFKREGSNEEECLSQMSSGERQLMHCISYIIYHIKNLESVTDDHYHIRYHNISLIFDEAELYYHPDYQRKFVGNLIKMLSWCNINHNIIRGVNILIVTHSPFVLSDIPLSNTLYLDDGEPVSKKKETFCGNVHELLGGNFFMDYSIGDVAKDNVEEIIRLYNQRLNKKLYDSNLLILRNNISRYRYIASIIADQYLNKKINDMINELVNLYEDTMFIDEQIRAVRERLQILEDKKKRLLL